MTERKRRTRKSNTIAQNVRVWLQLPADSVTVALGLPTTENKTNLPECWEVGHLPVYFCIGLKSIALTDLTVEELDQLVQAFNLAVKAARPICEVLDDRAFAALNSGAALEEVPTRVLRGRSPQLIRDIDTRLRDDPYDDDVTEQQNLAG